MGSALAIHSKTSRPTRQQEEHTYEYPNEARKSPNKYHTTKYFSH